MKKTKISVVAPCYNEEKYIRKNIKIINDFLSSRFDDYEIIAVNDGSRDNTSRELDGLRRELGINIVDISANQGKGKAVKVGVLASRKDCDVVMFLDSDLGIPIRELDKFIPELENGYDIVIASRFVPGLKIIRPVQLYRRMMEKCFRLLRMLIINNWTIKDTQCGFKVFRREAAMKIFPKLSVNRWAFDAELVFVANKFEYKIKELPIHLQNPPSRSLRLFRDPINMVWDLLRIRVNDWRGRYDKDQ